MPSADASDLAGPLRAWLAPRIGLDGDDHDLSIVRLERPAVGQSGHLLLFDATWAGGDRQLGGVVRLEDPDPLFPDRDVLSDAQTLSGLAGTTVPAPRILWVEPDPGPLGAPFYVMERLHGTVPAGKPSMHLTGWLPTLSPGRRRQLAHAGIEAMVDVHAVDWRRHLPRLAEQRGATLGRYVDWLTSWYRTIAGGRAHPIIDAGIEAVRAGESSASGSEPVLLWGDARPGNLMFDDHIGLVAVLDWELARVGPREVDVGYWVFMDEFHAEAQDIGRLDGWPDRSETLAVYEHAAGELADLAYYELVANVFLAATIVKQADRRIAAGQLDPSSRVAHDNVTTVMLARRLGLPEPSISGDFVRWRAGPEQVAGTHSPPAGS